MHEESGDPPSPSPLAPRSAAAEGPSWGPTADRPPTGARVRHRRARRVHRPRAPCVRRWIWSARTATRPTRTATISFSARVATRRSRGRRCRHPQPVRNRARPARGAMPLPPPAWVCRVPCRPPRSATCAPTRKAHASARTTPAACPSRAARCGPARRSRRAASHLLLRSARRAPPRRIRCAITRDAAAVSTSSAPGGSGGSRASSARSEAEREGAIGASRQVSARGRQARDAALARCASGRGDGQEGGATRRTRSMRPGGPSPKACSMHTRDARCLTASSTRSRASPSTLPSRS